jgi:hypothetical protein
LGQLAALCKRRSPLHGAVGSETPGVEGTLDAISDYLAVDGNIRAKVRAVGVKRRWRTTALGAEQRDLMPAQCHRDDSAGKNLQEKTDKQDKRHYRRGKGISNELSMTELLHGAPGRATATLLRHS